MVAQIKIELFQDILTRMYDFLASCKESRCLGVPAIVCILDDVYSIHGLCFIVFHVSNMFEKSMFETRPVRPT